MPRPGPRLARPLPCRRPALGVLTREDAFPSHGPLVSSPNVTGGRLCRRGPRMLSSVTLLCPTRAHRKAVDICAACAVDLDLEGSEEAWDRLILGFPTGTMVLTSLVRRAPGDRFSKLVLSMHNFLRTIATDAQRNKEFV